MLNKFAIFAIFPQLTPIGVGQAFQPDGDTPKVGPERNVMLDSLTYGSVVRLESLTYGLIALCCVWIGLASAAACARGGENGRSDLTISSGELVVRYDAAAGTVSIRRGAKPFIPQAAFGDFLPGENRTVAAGAEPTRLGPARFLRVGHSCGRAVKLSLVEGLPFVLVQASIHNRAAKPLQVGEILPLAATIDLGTPLAGLRTLGYDGLLPADQPRTRFFYLAAVDPKSHAGLVCGWLSHDRASGLVWSRGEQDKLHVEPISQYGRLAIPSGATLEGEILAVGLFDDAAEGLEKLAETIFRFYRLRVKPVPSGYMTWYHARALDEKRMPQLAEWCAGHLKKYGFEFLQIDDGWQAADRDFTTHDPKGAYPSGMKPTAEAITKRGFAAGIWLTPFGWDHKRPVFAGHQDWFVKRRDGSVYAVTWGGDCLDMSHPEARKFLEETIGRMSHEWGYKFFKLDGLWAGVAARLLYPDPTFRPDGFGDAVFHDPEMSNVEAFRTGLKAVRRAAGPEAYLLGCTVAQNMRTLGASIGLVDGIRIGIDSGRSWPGILANVNTSTAMYFLHGRVWHNDPDVLYLDKSFTLDQVRSFASWLAVTGQMVMVSEWLPDVPPERMEIVRRTIPNHNLRARPLDLFETFPARIWHLRSGEGDSRRDVLGVFNWDDKPRTIAVELARLGLSERSVAFDFWYDRLVPVSGRSLRLDLAPRSCRMLVLRPEAKHPQVVSTSRHVTQGMVDLAREHWDASAGMLHGVSRVVAGDPYELRIVGPAAAETWQPHDARVSSPDSEAGVSIEAKAPTTALVSRVAIRSPENREVRWSIEFRRLRHVDAPKKEGRH
jgi:hypothetical protein